MTGKRFYSVNGYPVYLKKKFYNFFLKFSWKNSTEDTFLLANITIIFYSHCQIKHEG